jgi:hypothetical protein
MQLDLIQYSRISYETVCFRRTVRQAESFYLATRSPMRRVLNNHNAPPLTAAIGDLYKIGISMTMVVSLLK